MEWSDQYGGVYRLKMLWWDALVVTDPFALAQICGRGEGALEKAADQYKPINYVRSVVQIPWNVCTAVLLCLYMLQTAFSASALQHNPAPAQLVYTCCSLVVL